MFHDAFSSLRLLFFKMFHCFRYSFFRLSTVSVSVCQCLFIVAVHVFQCLLLRMLKFFKVFSSIRFVSMLVIVSVSVFERV